MIDEDLPLEEILPHDDEAIPPLDAPPLDEVPADELASDLPVLDEPQAINVATAEINASPISDPYLVKSGDTLSAIAKRCGHSVAELKRFNHISNPNQLDVGQTLYLSEKSALGVSVLFLDPLRHPIENLPYQLRYDGKVVHKTTGHTGATSRQITRSAQSPFEVWIRNADHQWQQIANTVSGYGHKLITLVSGAIVVKGKTELHPHGAPLTPQTIQKPAPRAHHEQAPLPKPAKGTPTKNNKHLKTKHDKAPKGQSVIKLDIEMPADLMAYFAHYKNVPLTEDDWAKAADTLACEVNVLKAIAEVESMGRSPFWRLNSVDGAYVPMILYERHKFNQYTKGKFKDEHSDIAWSQTYLPKKSQAIGSKNIKMHDQIVAETDFYSDYASSYLRLINAYKLDKEAALKACSWGKFQIMGERHVICCENGLASFVTAMCTSEAGQIDMLVGFIKGTHAIYKNRKKPSLGKEISLWEAVKKKEWNWIALYYNGGGYSKNNYHKKLKAAYEKFNETT